MESMDRSISYWDERWQSGQTQWHKDFVELYLKSYSHELFGCKSNIKVLMPLCGKSVDIKWIADQGHTVVGIEGSVIPIEAFFSKHSISYTTHTSNSLGITVYQSDDGLIRIYHCNLFEFNASVEGQFDAIWDVGSIVAISAVDRVRYATLLLSLLAPGGRYLVKTYEYDEQHYGGPPCNVPGSLLIELFGHACTVRLLDQKDVKDGSERFSPNFDYFNTTLYLIVPKQ